MRLLTLSIIFLISLISINAQSELTTDAIIQQETQTIIDENTEDPELENVGITPDQAGYGFKLGIEKLRLAFTFDRARKADAALELAELRLKEARLMIVEDNLDSLEKIKTEHSKYLDIAQENIALLEENEDALEIQAELEVSLDEQETQIDEIDSLILLKSNELTDEEEDQLLDFIEEVEIEKDEVEFEVEDKGVSIKAKLRGTGLNEENIQDMLDFHRNLSKNFTREDILKRNANHQVDQAQKMYDLASRLIEKAKNINNTNMTVNFTLGDRTLELHEEAKLKLDEAKTDLEEMHYLLAIGHAHQSKRLSALTIASIHHGISPVALADRLEKIENLLKGIGKGRGKLGIELEDGLGNEVEIEIEIEDDDEVEDELEDEHFIGVIESISDTKWVIGGKEFTVNAETILDSGLVEGVEAEVELVELADGSLVAVEIETDNDEEDEDDRSGSNSGSGY